MATGSSVPPIKAPFPAKLTQTPRTSDEQSPATPCSRELRRSGTSSDDLRGLARQHAASTVTSPLPSPITHDAKDETDSYFGFSHSRAASQTLNDAVLDKLQIFSYYCNEEDTISTTGDFMCAESVTDDKADDNDESTASDSFPVTPIDQTSHAFVCSDESGWLANTTSHDERRRRFKARFFQIVEHPCSQDDPEYADGQVMVATVLVGSGKPRIVQIQRPVSRRKGSAPTPEISQSPSTPVQSTVEISAFSPYDTPGEEVATQMTQPNSLAATTCIPSDEVQLAHPSGQPRPVPASLSNPKRRPMCHQSRHGVCNIAGSQMSPCLADPFTVSARRWSTCSESSTFINPRRHERDDRLDLIVGQPSSHLSSPTEEVATRSRCRKMERILRAVTQAIFNYPDGVPRLDSSSVLEVRSPDVADQTYIDTLGKIFPTAPDTLLSSLVAWILFDIYFTQLEDASEQPGVHGGGGREEVVVHHNMNGNTNIQRIPAKARAMLGLDDQTGDSIPSVCSTVHGLGSRARTVHTGMGIVSRRLMGALRGSWDEDIWRSLKVLVEVIESGGFRSSF
ncbi:hypothetical protein LTS17_009105 [Exophiala oligosperma]